MPTDKYGPAVRLSLPPMPERFRLLIAMDAALAGDGLLLGDFAREYGLGLRDAIRMLALLESIEECSADADAGDSRVAYRWPPGVGPVFAENLRGHVIGTGGDFPHAARERILAAISERGLTITAVAEHAGTSRPSLCHLLAGRRRGSVDLWRRIAAVVGLDVCEHRRVTVTPIPAD
jgi:lambda repressor-like predicted transcriptional regulator